MATDYKSKEGLPTSVFIDVERRSGRMLSPVHPGDRWSESLISRPPELHTDLDTYCPGPGVLPAFIPQKEH